MSLTRKIAYSFALLSLIPFAGNGQGNHSSDKAPNAEDMVAAPKKEEDLKLKNGQIVGSVVARFESSSGIKKEFFRDLTIRPNKIWGPLSEVQMNFEQAKKYCGERTDLGLKWMVPTYSDLLGGFNPGNTAKNTRGPDATGYTSNHQLSEAIGMKPGEKFWSSSPSKYAKDWAVVFYYPKDIPKTAGTTWGSSPNDQLPVRCVAQQ